MIAIRKKDGQIFEVQKYIKSDTEISIWCNDWYGRHVVGQDCDLEYRKSIPVQFAVWLSLSDTAREYYDRHTTLSEDNISELYDIFTEENSIKP